MRIIFYTSFLIISEAAYLELTNVPQDGDVYTIRMDFSNSIQRSDEITFLTNVATPTTVSHILEPTFSSKVETSIATSIFSSKIGTPTSPYVFPASTPSCMPVWINQTHWGNSSISSPSFTANGSIPTGFRPAISASAIIGFRKIYLFLVPALLCSYSYIGPS